MINVFIREPNNFNMREHLLHFWRSILTVVSRMFIYRLMWRFVSSTVMLMEPIF